MIHIHPFPARMAPDIVFDAIYSLPEGSKILDPMSGSGMVINRASRMGLIPFGVDLDPLARLLSKVSATKIDSLIAKQEVVNLIAIAKKRLRNENHLPWIDDDEETLNFIAYWFCDKQAMQLRALSYCLHRDEIISDPDISDVIKVAISRLIVTKDPKASLARDTAHSRPHKVIYSNDFDVFAELPNSLNHVLAALNPNEIITNATVYSGDARDLHFFESNFVDSIVTSPPYLNAIDYMRGNKFSLIWLGYSISNLRKIRSTQIGSESAMGTSLTPAFVDILEQQGLWTHSCKNTLMLQRYYSDLSTNAKECFRALKPQCNATFVIGNSNIQDKYIKNSELLKNASLSAGFKFVNEVVREIPDNKRYMPITTSSASSMTKRMRAEHIITFSKPY